MLIVSSLCVAFLALLTQATIVAGSNNNTDSVVSLSYATFQGAIVGNVTQFLGMPYAQPPYVHRRRMPCSSCWLFPPYLQNQRSAIPPPVASNATSWNTTSRIVWLSVSTTSRVTYTWDKFCTKLHVHLWRLSVINFDCLLSHYSCAYTGLYINVLRPAEMHADKKLPVAVVLSSLQMFGILISDFNDASQWIFGGLDLLQTPWRSFSPRLNKAPSL